MFVSSMRLQLLIPAFSACLSVFGQTSPCSLKQVLHNPKEPLHYSPDSSQYFVNKQDTAGKFQIYVANAGDTNLTCISDQYTTGNCCGLLRHWSARNKLQVQWHKSGQYIICGVEKEFYNELLYTPYNILLGWLQSGMWMDIWAVKPDGSQWWSLASTIHGMTGPAFTPDGSKCVWSEALDSANLAVDKFGRWKLRLSDFNSVVPAFANTSDITPAGSRWNEPGNFHPNGKWVLITADIGIANAEGQDQFILDITNGNITNLNNSPMVWDEHGVFSPDGNKILFMSSEPYKADTNSYHTLTIKTEFMLMNSDGTGLQQLTHFRTPGYPEYHPGIAATGHFSPKDSVIYGQSLIFPNYENWIIKFHGPCGGTALTDVDEAANSGDLRIFPNPVRNMLNIETGFEMQNASLKIINALGQTVKNIPGLNGTQLSIPTADLENSVYFLQLEEGDVRVCKMFVRQE